MGGCFWNGGHGSDRVRWTRNGGQDMFADDASKKQGRTKDKCESKNLLAPMVATRTTTQLTTSFEPITSDNSGLHP